MATPEAIKRRISSILYRWVVSEKRAQVDEIAATTGKSGSLIYKILENDCSIFVHDLPAFYQAANRPVDVLRELVAQCDPFLAVVSVAEADKIDGSLQDEKDDLVIETGRLFAFLNDSLDDGRFGEQERTEFRTRIAQFQTIIDRLTSEVNAHA